MRLSIGVALWVLATITGICCAAQPIKFTGTFSDMKYSQEAGDVVGHELRIVFTNAGYEGAYQVAEGEPSRLILVTIQFNGNQVRFSVLSGQYAGSFIGVIGPKGISGTFAYKSGATEKINLPRSKSYWD